MTGRSLAILVTLCPVMALAQAPDPITLYGRVFVALESVEAAGDEGRATPLKRRTRVSDQSSLLGVRGSEALGGALSAVFQLETVFKADENNSTFANRNSGIGLRGVPGTVVLGRWDTPLKAATTGVDAFSDLTLGGITAALNGSGLAGRQGTFDRRDTNVIQYWSPVVGGFALRLSHAVNEGRTGFLNPSQSGASLVYSAGTWYAGYAYDELRDGTFAIELEKQAAHAIFGHVTFGPLRVGLVHERILRPTFSTQKAWMANAIASFGSHQFIYQYQRARGGSDNRFEPIPAAGVPVPHVLFLVPGEPRCDVHVAAYQYHFSRRTMLLAQYVRISNNLPSTCNFGTNPLPIDGGQDLRGATLGMRHLF
ncbi:MAG TPA: porin [Usitatibacter sp.]|nr:porin [Usitatibacter sp.]